jgi:hypothetical protein
MMRPTIYTVRDGANLNIEFDPDRFREHLNTYAGVLKDLDDKVAAEIINRGRAEELPEYDEP